jgi:hypothetical protein
VTLPFGSFALGQNSAPAKRERNLDYNRQPMPHEFTEYEDEPEPQSSSAHGGSPGQLTGAGILDPPVPPRRPRRPPSPIPALGWPVWMRVCAAIALACFGILMLFALLRLY